jgi:hypothetical protein
MLNTQTQQSSYAAWCKTDFGGGEFLRDVAHPLDFDELERRYPNPYANKTSMQEDALRASQVAEAQEPPVPPEPELAKVYHIRQGSGQVAVRQTTAAA